MKKIFFAFFAVVALALVGCEGQKMDIMSLDPSQLDNTEYKCWKYTIKNVGDFNTVGYAWDTESGIVKTLQNFHKMYKGKAKISYTETPADDKNGCESLNPSLD